MSYTRSTRTQPTSVFKLYSFIAIILLLFVWLYFNSKNETSLQHNDCKRYHNWAWIHAPRNGLVSQLNELDEI